MSSRIEEGSKQDVGPARQREREKEKRPGSASERERKEIRDEEERF